MIGIEHFFFQYILIILTVLKLNTRDKIFAVVTKQKVIFKHLSQFEY